MTMEEIRRDLPYARGRRRGYPLIDPDWRSIRFRKKLFASGSSWSSAGAFEMYLWPGRTLSVKRGRGSEPAVEVDMDDSMTTGDEVVRGILRLGVEWESHERGAGVVTTESERVKVDA